MRPVRSAWGTPRIRDAELHVHRKNATTQLDVSSSRRSGKTLSRSSWEGSRTRWSALPTQWLAFSSKHNTPCSPPGRRSSILDRCGQRVLRRLGNSAQSDSENFDMANWYGSARSNYVRIKDKSAFRAWAGTLPGVDLVEKNGRFALLVRDSDTGGWPSLRCDANGEDQESDPDRRLCRPRDQRYWDEPAAALHSSPVRTDKHRSGLLSLNDPTSQEVGIQATRERHTGHRHAQLLTGCDRLGFELHAVTPSAPTGQAGCDPLSSAWWRPEAQDSYWLI